MKIENVLVPVDFSPPSRLALDHAIVFARKCHARLTLLNVIEAFWDVMYVSKSEIAAIETQHRDQTSRMLSALMSPADLNHGNFGILIKAGMIGDQILSTIQEEHIDAVVMGTHGRGLLGRLLIGSVTQQILRRAAVPVMTVCRVTRPLRLDRVLFATDLSNASSQAFQHAVNLVDDLGSSLTVLHVLEARSRIEDAREQLSRMVSQVLDDKIKIEQLLREGNRVEVILSAAEETTAGVIIVALENKGLFERLAPGSVPERLIRESHLPVYSIPVAGNG
jgi:nucleotide-binding universal stress UspA family protein